MNIELRTIIVAAIALLVHFFTGELNHYLAPLHLHVYLGGLLITFPILRFPYRQGFFAVLLIALFHNSITAAPFGASLALFLGAHAVVHSVRSRFPREEPPAALAIALILNGALFLAFSAIQMPESPAPGPFWRRILADLAVSQAAVLVLAGWFFALQSEALRYFGIHLDKEQRRAE